MNQKQVVNGSQNNMNIFNPFKGNYRQITQFLSIIIDPIQKTQLSKTKKISTNNNNKKTEQPSQTERELYPQISEAEIKAKQLTK